MCKCGVNFNLGKRRMIFLSLFHVHVVFHFLIDTHPTQKDWNSFTSNPWSASTIGTLACICYLQSIPSHCKTQFFVVICGKKSKFPIHAFSTIHKELTYIPTVSYTSLLCIFGIPSSFFSELTSINVPPLCSILPRYFPPSSAAG